MQITLNGFGKVHGMEMAKKISKYLRGLPGNISQHTQILYSVFPHPDRSVIISVIASEDLSVAQGVAKFIRKMKPKTQITTSHTVACYLPSRKLSEHDLIMSKLLKGNPIAKMSDILEVF